MEIEPVSYTHLDVYKRQVLGVTESVTSIGGQNGVKYAAHPFLYNFILYPDKKLIIIHCRNIDEISIN